MLTSVDRSPPDTSYITTITMITEIYDHDFRKDITVFIDETDTATWHYGSKLKGTSRQCHSVPTVGKPVLTD